MQENEIFEILQKQVQERQQQKKETMFSLKRKKIQEMKQEKKKLVLQFLSQSDGLAKHVSEFIPPTFSGQLFQKSEFLLPKKSKGNLNRIQSAWLPTYTNSRLISAVPPDLEPLPRPPSQKEKLWRPFSSQPNRLNMLHLTPHSPKDCALTPKKNSLALDTGEKLIPMKPFLPTRRIFSAFPK